MKRPLLTVSLLLVAAVVALPSARAQHEEKHEEKHDDGKPHKKHPAAAKPKPKPKPKPAAPGKPHAPAKSATPSKPGMQGKLPPGEAVRPTPTPRPASGLNPQRASPPPMMPAPKQAPPPPAVVPASAPPARPQPITDPNHFVRHWAPPPAPAAGAPASVQGATPVNGVPSEQHTAVLGNTAVVTTIISNQQNEVAPNRYYWHNDGGYDYVHYYSGGAHWYGFYVGPNYYWAQRRADRWWWYDPATQRYLYFSGGYWWWQNPIQPETLYVYQSGMYVPYSGTGADAPAAPAPAAAPAKPAVPAPPPFADRSDVDVPAYSVDPNANRFALVVGVEDYPGRPKADFAVRDAQAVRAHLLSLGYPDKNVVLLAGAGATRAAFAEEIERGLAKKVGAGSRVFVYFAGDGAPDPKSGVAYLLPADGDARNLASTGYSLNQLYAALNALPAKEIVVALDAGFSGSGGRSAGGAPAASVDAGRAFAGRIVVFSAAGPGETVGTLPDQSHGLFTYNFLKGLNGAAAQGADGVTVQGLFDSLAPGVEDAAGREHRAQTPQLLVPPDGQRRLLIKDLR